jgi:2-iminobutanoate/2-iminopropanoate deaminase
MADRRRRHGEFGGGPLEAAMPGRGFEGAKRSERRQLARRAGGEPVEMRLPHVSPENSEFVGRDLSDQHSSVGAGTARRACLPWRSTRWRRTMLERVSTDPDNYEPFLLSQGIRFGDLLFVSGQAGAADDGRIVEGGFMAQGEQAFANLRRVLEAGGSSLGDVIKVTIFVTDMRHFEDVVALRRRFFSAPYPADTIAEIKALYDPAAMIEIEAIAAVRPRSA